MNDRQRRVIEAIGALLFVLGVSILNVAAALIAAGVLLILAATYADNEGEP